MNKWDKKNACWMLLYTVLYALMTALVCVLGSIHPLLFVCYQITAGILLSGIVTVAFGRIRAPGAAACLSLAVLILLLVIGDAVLWHVVPLIVIAALAELVRAVSRYSRIGDVIGAVVMSGPVEVEKPAAADAARRKRSVCACMPSILPQLPRGGQARCARAAPLLYSCA